MGKGEAFKLNPAQKTAALINLKNLQQSIYEQMETIYNSIIEDPIYNKTLFEKYSGKLLGPEATARRVKYWMDIKDHLKYNFSEGNQKWYAVEDEDATIPTDGLRNMVFSTHNYNNKTRYRKRKIKN